MPVNIHHSSSTRNQGLALFAVRMSSPGPLPIGDRPAVARREVAIREKTLYRMPYETAARAAEILDLDIDDARPGGPPRPGGGQGGAVEDPQAGPHSRGRRAGAVYWDAGTARRRPRLLKDRTRVPMFLTRRRPDLGKILGPRDVCPDTGLARLSYGQARALLDGPHALRGPGTGWDLHESRHSALTHLGLLGGVAAAHGDVPAQEARQRPPLLQAIGRRLSPRSTSLLAPGDSRR